MAVVVGGEGRPEVIPKLSSHSLADQKYKSRVKTCTRRFVEMMEADERDLSYISSQFSL